MTIIDALAHPDLFGGLPCFRDLSTWQAWMVFLKAVYGLPLEPFEMAVFRRHTGRTSYAPPAGGYPEAVAVVGVQSGKSRVAAAVAGFAALTGARGTHAVLVGQDHRGAMRVLLRYSREPFEVLPLFQDEAVRLTADTVELKNGVLLSAYPCRPESVRGLSACIVVIDELAFFISTDGRPTDTEMLRVARGRVATTGGKVIVLSSPYGQSGALWDLHRKHYGRDESSTLVWQASAPDMNPTLPADYLERMRADDPEAALSEVEGQFRAGLSALLDPSVIQDAVDAGVRERPQQPGIQYHGFFDAASGSGKDAAVLAIAHADGERVVLDLIRRWAPPFNPSGAIAEAADLLRAYGLHDVEGDRYAPGFVLEAFRANTLTYRFSERDRSALYLEAVPLFNSGRVRLLEHAELLRELRGLERRRGPSGRDKVDHRRGAHDDVSNASCGALVLAARTGAFLCSLCSDPECHGIHGADPVDEATIERRSEQATADITGACARQGCWMPGD